jgi:hypothetical protein
MYEYSPRPPNAPNPPITPHEFEIALHPCPSGCLLSAFHDCIEEPINGDFCIQRIPKRKERFPLASYGIEVAWGIHAEHNISAIYVVLYHVVILAGTFAFWVVWQIGHPDDLQNAAVPMTVVVTLLSLFWSSSGVLKGPRTAL